MLRPAAAARRGLRRCLRVRRVRRVAGGDSWMQPHATAAPALRRACTVPGSSTCGLCSAQQQQFNQLRVAAAAHAARHAGCQSRARRGACTSCQHTRLACLAACLPPLPACLPTAPPAGPHCLPASPARLSAHLPPCRRCKVRRPPDSSVRHTRNRRAGGSGLAWFTSTEHAWRRFVRVVGYRRVCRRCAACCRMPVMPRPCQPAALVKQLEVYTIHTLQQ